MALHIYNTMTRTKEEFVPQEPDKVKMYVCGPTVYGYMHIGNARPVIVFDMVRNYLETLGNEVRYLTNFTDVDDKMIRKAEEPEHHRSRGCRNVHCRLPGGSGRAGREACDDESARYGEHGHDYRVH